MSYGEKVAQFGSQGKVELFHWKPEALLASSRRVLTGVLGSRQLESKYLKVHSVSWWDPQ